MDIFTLMIGRSLTIPFAISLERTEKQQPELAVIDFALLSKATRSLSSDNRRDPCWDPLQKDPRFDKLLAELAPFRENEAQNRSLTPNTGLIFDLKKRWCGHDDAGLRHPRKETYLGYGQVLTDMFKRRNTRQFSTSKSAPIHGVRPCHAFRLR